MSTQRMTSRLNTKCLCLPLDKKRALNVRQMHLRSVLRDAIVPCTFRVRADEDKGWDVLDLAYSNNSDLIEAMHQLERKLGILLTVDDIARIRTEMTDGVCHFGDRGFINMMQQEMHDGVTCIHYYEKGKSRTTIITVPERNPRIPDHQIQRTCDRLFWKGSVESKNEEKESCHLCDIEQFKLGKGQCTPDDVDEGFCFSVVTKEETRDYFVQTQFPSSHVEWIVAYLNGIRRHFSEPCARRLQNEKAVNDKDLDDKSL